MKKNLFLSACVAVAMAFALPSHAQRLIPKQKGIEVAASVPLIKGEKLFAEKKFGVGVSLTKYLKRENYAFISAEYEEQSLPYCTYQVPMRDMLLQVGYMQPILSDRGKNISLPTSVSPPSGAMRNSMKKSLYYLMGQPCLTARASSMAVRCIVRWSASSRIDCSSSSRRKGDCSSARMFIVFVQLYRLDLDSTYNNKQQ